MDRIKIQLFFEKSNTVGKTVNSVLLSLHDGAFGLAFEQEVIV